VHSIFGPMLVYSESLATKSFASSIAEMHRKKEITQCGSSRDYHILASNHDEICWSTSEQNVLKAYLDYLQGTFSMISFAALSETS
jgi:hypothetical protein